MTRLAGKTTLVVGVGQSVHDETIGNGRATALAFCRQGAPCLLMDRDPDSLAETAHMIEAESGTCATEVVDVTDDASCTAAGQACVDCSGTSEALFNNVGVITGDRPVDAFDAAAWDAILVVNARGMAFTCKHAMPVLRRQGGGSIVNVSSVVSTVRDYPVVACKASKAPVNALTQHVAVVGAPDGVSANVLLVVRIVTPVAAERMMRERGIADRATLVEANDAAVPLRRKAGSVWDVANTAVFLASDESAFITGAVLPVLGGESAHLISRSM